MKTIQIYKDRNENLYVKTGRKIGFMVRIIDGTMHDGTTMGDFFLVKEIDTEALRQPDVIKSVCDHPFASVMSKCNGEINHCLKCGEHI